MKKRLLALLTSLALAFSVVPSVFAEGETTEETVTTVNGFSKIMATSYDHLRTGNGVRPNVGGYMEMKRYGGLSFQNVDFGEGADKIILDVTSSGIKTWGDVLTFRATTAAWQDTYTESSGSETYLKSGTLLAKATSNNTGSYEKWSTKHYVVSNPSALKGIVNLNMYVLNTASPGGWDNLLSFQFNKAVNPYEQLLTEAVTTGKEIKSLYFDGTGADSIDLSYTGAGTLSIYKDTSNGANLTNLVATIELDETGTKTTKVDNASFTGATDLYFAVTEGVSLEGVKFNTVPSALEGFKILEGVTDYLVNFEDGGYNGIALEGVSIADAGLDATVTFTAGEQTIEVLVSGNGTVRTGIKEEIVALNNVQNLSVSFTNMTASAIKFEKLTDGFSKINAASASKIRQGSISGANKTQIKDNGAYMQMTRYGGMTYQNVDFGDGADDYVLDIVTSSDYAYGDKLEIRATTTAWNENTAWAENSTSENYLKSGTSIASIPSMDNNAWTTWQLRHFVVSNPSALKGIVNLNFYVKPTATPANWDNINSFQFNKAVNPYAELLTESITDAKEIKSLYFKGNGAKSVTFDYAVSEGAEAVTVEVYNDTINGTKNMTAIDTFTLEQGAVEKTIKVDATKYQGVKDLYFKVSNGTVSGIAFEELGLLDPFANDTVSALYIGNGADDWTADVKAEFEGSLAYYEKSYTDTYVNLGEKSDVEYLDFLANIPAADIVFIQAGAKAEAILAELANLETKPIVLVIGNAAYAAGYGVKAIATGAGEFAKSETYDITLTKKATREAYGEIKAISFDDHYVAAQEGKYDRVNNFNGTGQYIMFKDVNFTNGIKNVTFNYANNATAKTGKLEVRIGSKTGTLIATSSACTVTGGWGAPDNKLDTVSVEQSLYGVYDVYVVSNSVAYGNLISIQFEADDSINAKSGLTTINGVASENLAVVDGTYYAMTEADSVTYTGVNFGETARNYYVDVEVAVSADAQGSLYIEEGNDTFVKYDLSEAGQNFKKISVMTNDAVSGLKDLSVSYSGTGTAYLKSITFRDVLSYEDVLGVDNYSVDATTAILNTNRFEKMDKENSYVVWKDVDFSGSEDKILTLKAQIGVADGYDGGYLTVRADSKRGPIIARAKVVHQTGMGWAVKGYYLEAPVVAKLTGTHDLYVSVDNGPVMEQNKAGNVFSIEFVENTSDAIVTDYWVDMEDPDEDGIWTKQDVNSAVSFKNADADLRKFVLVTAVYGANGLVGIDYNVCDAVVGVNTALSTVSASALETSYTVKTFLWNADTLKPIIAEAIINENVTAQ